MHTNTHRNTNTNTITGRQNMQMANYAHCVRACVCVCATNLILSKPQIDKYFNLHNKHTHTQTYTLILAYLSYILIDSHWIYWFHFVNSCRQNRNAALSESHAAFSSLHADFSLYPPLPTTLSPSFPRLSFPYFAASLSPANLHVRLC